MFDDGYHNRAMYASETCDQERGVVINFHKPIIFKDILIYTRGYCCRKYRYRGVCLYADGVKFACTPTYQPDPGRTINFKDFLLDPGQKIVGSEFRMMWELNPPQDEACAQIEELFFHFLPVYVGNGPLGGCKPYTKSRDRNSFMKCKNACKLGAIGRDLNFKWYLKTERNFVGLITVKSKVRNHLFENFEMANHNAGVFKLILEVIF